MGITKNYLKYSPAGQCNLIASHMAGLEVLPGTQTVCVGACENVLGWDLHTQEKIMTLEGGLHLVTCLVRSGNGFLAVGYQNGEVRIFNMITKEFTITLTGHKTSVACLAYDFDEGIRLASGGKDTDIVIWDIVSERGLCRLKGHKNEVTQVQFLKTKNILISSSKDYLVKFWDLDTHHCFKSLADHICEVRDFVVCKNDSILITGSASQDLRIWKLKFNEVELMNSENKMKNARLDFEVDADDDDDNNQLQCISLGTIVKEGKVDCVSMSISSSGNLLGCHGNDKNLVIYKITSDRDLEKRLKKRTKNLKKKALQDGTDESLVEAELTSEDILVHMLTIRTSFKLRAFQFIESGKDKAKVVALLKDNSFEIFEIDLKAESSGFKSKLSWNGHRANIRTVCFSSDSSAIMSGSRESIRIWNRSTLRCIRMIDSGYATCSAFVYGDKHVVIGTLSGHLEIYDIAAALLNERIEGHVKAVWSICMTPDKQGLASGGEDKDLILWEFDSVTEIIGEDKTQKRSKLTLIPRKKVKMDDEIICLKYSSDQKYLAISLLNNNVYVYFADTMKLFHTLYGHAYAVTCLDISTDCTMIATGSVDKDIRIWDLDFCQCRHIIKCAHDGQINYLQFLPKTHMFFTCANDGTVKQWDGDTFKNITTLQGHHYNVSCLAVSPDGNFVASASTDMSLRLWEKTDEILVIDEENELVREKETDELEKEELVIPGDYNTEVTIVGNKSVKTMSSADKLMEALDLLTFESDMKEQVLEAMGVALPTT